MKPFGGNGDVSIRVKNSRVERKIPNKRTKKLKQTKNLEKTSPKTKTNTDLSAVNYNMSYGATVKASAANTCSNLIKLKT